MNEQALVVWRPTEILVTGYDKFKDPGVDSTFSYHHSEKDNLLADYFDWFNRFIVPPELNANSVKQSTHWVTVDPLAGILCRKTIVYQPVIGTISRCFLPGQDPRSITVEQDVADALAQK